MIGRRKKGKQKGEKKVEDEEKWRYILQEGARRKGKERQEKDDTEQ